MNKPLHRGVAIAVSASGGLLAGTRLVSALLSAGERHAIEAAALPPRTIAANRDLVREGETTDQIHILTEGWACRFKTTFDGSRQIVALLVPGDVVNLDALMFRRPHYGVRSLTPATVVSIASGNLLELADGHAGIARALTRLALIENAILGQWALCLGRHSAHKRLAHLFCELAVRLGGDEPVATAFDMPLTQEQLADALGLTPVHVNRTIKQLRHEGLVETSSRAVGLPDVRRLRDEAEFDPAYLHIEAGEHVTRREVAEGQALPSSSPPPDPERQPA
jgi:CRP-like cAMP-binding protein